jgi:hypothetical protein
MKDFEKINPGEAKVNEYVARIEAGEDKEKILKDLPNSFKSAIEKKIPQHSDKEKKTEARKFEIPPQYKGLPSFVLDEIWVVPVYLDEEKNKTEKEKKNFVLEMLRKEEMEKAESEEAELAASERINEIKKELKNEKKIEITENENDYNKFSVANGETDNGVFWYQYRNKKAKDLKNAGSFEWGKERIYFDIKMEDMEKLRDLVILVAGQAEIAVAFKYLDEKKTIPVQKDGKETRFVVNFSLENDAKKFLLAMKKNPAYISFITDRNMNHGGVRVDGIAEYASGFREVKSALERIMRGSFNSDGNTYSYLAESGREIKISKIEYLVFKKQYDKYCEEIKTKQKEWEKYFN